MCQCLQFTITLNEYHQIVYWLCSILVLFECAYGCMYNTQHSTALLLSNRMFLFFLERGALFAMVCTLSTYITCASSVRNFYTCARCGLKMGRLIYVYRVVLYRITIPMRCYLFSRRHLYMHSQCLFNCYIIMIVAGIKSPLYILHIMHSTYRLMLSNRQNKSTRSRGVLFSCHCCTCV